MRKPLSFSFFMPMAAFALASTAWSVESRSYGAQKPQFEAIEAIDGQGACGVPEAVQLFFADGQKTIAILPPAKVSRDLVPNLSLWSVDVQAAALEHLGSSVVSLRNAASYVCRARNNQPGARISQHAFGRALDISSFQLQDGRQVSVLEHYDDKDARGAFLKAVEALNCLHFKTALGPRSDVHHQDHFHVDLAVQSRTSHYCR